MLEYCGNGSLIEWLQAAEAVRETGELLLIMHGISAGMKYLASRRFVHRDLAARNILLGDDMTPKVSPLYATRGSPVRARACVCVWHEYQHSGEPLSASSLTLRNRPLLFVWIARSC